uniref:SET domain-containing protein n=1 Tax=Pectinophora gossypiella TaxID=13191 RepID=A0A1E1WDH3_PECGO
MFFSKPDLINYLSENGHLDHVYKVLDDPSEVVVTLMKVMNETGTMPQCVEDFKSESISNMFRLEGNQAYKAKHFGLALESYNKSLSYAPTQSTAMKLAYGNRSALLYTLKQYTDCMNDIDTIFSMGCADFDLAERLNQRKNQCEKMAKASSDLETNSIKNGLAGKFFNFDVKRHPEIPCASTDISVIMESGLPKVVAAKDIQVGTLVSLESPFVCELNASNYWIACHYCHKFKFNLMPCDGCTVALFCDEICKKKCYIEFHNIECQIMSCFHSQHGIIGGNMNIRAALKMKQKCKTWKELITASFSIGEDRMRNSCVSDIYDKESKFSMLSFDNNLHFVHGKTINCGVPCAIELHYLKGVPNFWPTCEDEKDEGVRAFARIMMKLNLFYPPVLIRNICLDALNVHSGNLVTSSHNFGWFAFTGKLKHSCDANLLALGLKNSIALVAVHPIQNGSELNISYLEHYYDRIPQHKYFMRSLHCLSPACSCRVCIENWNVRDNSYRDCSVFVSI